MQPRVKRIAGFEVERHVLAFVEAELRQYPARKQEAARLEADLIHRTPRREAGMPRSGRVPDPTTASAMSLVTNRRLEWLRAWCDLVEETLNSLPNELQALIHEVYFRGDSTMAGAALSLGVDRSTLFRRRDEALLPFVAVLVGDQALIYPA